MEYKTTVADTEEVLTELSKIVELPYTKGSFSLVEDEFVDSGKNDELYIINTKVLEVTVLLEKYEGYFSISIAGNGSTFNTAKAYLSKCS